MFFNRCHVFTLLVSLMFSTSFTMEQKLGSAAASSMPATSGAAAASVAATSDHAAGAGKADPDDKKHMDIAQENDVSDDEFFDNMMRRSQNLHKNDDRPYDPFSDPKNLIAAAIKSGDHEKLRALVQQQKSLDYSFDPNILTAICEAGADPHAIYEKDTSDTELGLIRRAVHDKGPRASQCKAFLAALQAFHLRHRAAVERALKTGLLSKQQHEEYARTRTMLLSSKESGAYNKINSIIGEYLYVQSDEERLPSHIVDAFNDTKISDRSVSCKVDDFRKMGGNLRAVDERNMNVLKLAIYNNRYWTLSHLWDNSDICYDSVTETGRNAYLDLAEKKGATGIAELIQGQLNVQLYYAVRARNVDLVESLLRQGADADGHLANSWEPILRTILDDSSSKNDEIKDDETHQRLVKLLLGSTKTVSSLSGLVTLTMPRLAFDQGRLHIAKILIDHYARYCHYDENIAHDLTVILYNAMDQYREPDFAKYYPVIEAALNAGADPHWDVRGTWSGPDIFQNSYVVAQSIKDKHPQPLQMIEQRNAKVAGNFTELSANGVMPAPLCQTVCTYVGFPERGIPENIIAILTTKELKAGEREKVRAYYEDYTNLGKTDTQGKTGIMLAARYGHFQLVQDLWKRYGDMKFINDLRKVNDAMKEVHRMLGTVGSKHDHLQRMSQKDVENYTDATLKDMSKTIQDLARGNGHGHILKYMLSENFHQAVRTNYNDRMGRQRLSAEEYERNMREIRALAQEDIDINWCGTLNSNLSFALKNPELFRLCLELGANIDLPLPGSSSTPLMRAIELHELSCARCLLYLGANTTLHDSDGLGALDYARKLSDDVPGKAKLIEFLELRDPTSRAAQDFLYGELSVDERREFTAIKAAREKFMNNQATRERANQQAQRDIKRQKREMKRRAHDNKKS